MKKLDHGHGGKLDQPDGRIRSAHVDGSDGVCVVRIGGRAMGVAPVVVGPQAPFGAVESHRIIIDIPPDAPDVAISCPIFWEVAAA